MNAGYYYNYINAICESVQKVVFSSKDGSVIDANEGLLRLCEYSKKIKYSNNIQYLCGNGASASICNHMALDWSKNGGIKTYSFSDSALFTAIVNDLGGENMFAFPLGIYANNGDLLITISSSGNSKNVIQAINQARKMNMHVITFSGLRSDNESRSLGDLNIYVPAKTYGIVESAHAIIMHAWLDKYMGITEWDRKCIQNMNIEQFQL